MLTFNDVRHIHLELSSRCNARCPRCPRNYYGYPYNNGYEEVDLSLKDFQKLVTSELLQNIKIIYVNGNHGDFIMNHHSVNIISYILKCNPQIKINASTNGSARNKKFWQDLGALGITVDFCIDGLVDTHGIYRQDTDYQTILNNAAHFIQAGGQAVWMYTEFPHNKHQVAEAKILAKELGFSQFRRRLNTRADGPIYNRSGTKIAAIGTQNPMGLPDQVDVDKIKLYNLKYNKGNNAKIVCQARQEKSIYISATGTVTPCCWIDLSKPTRPRTGPLYQDKELETLLGDITRIDLSRTWFQDLQQSWAEERTQPAVCQQVCGVKNDLVN